MTPALAAVEPQVLAEGWEYHQGALSSSAAVWSSGGWQRVSIPHCFNARDAVDPDQPYYQGMGWYRLRLPVANPYPGGRTILQFDGAGQDTEVHLGDRMVGSHRGGYDGWSVDLTSALAGATVAALAVRCDNSAADDTIPSDLSDFCRYGGLYRHVRLRYVPALALGSVHALTSVSDEGSATLTIRATVEDPGALGEMVDLDLTVTAPDGTRFQRTVPPMAPWSGPRDLATFTLPSVRRWSPDDPQLYRCTVTLRSSRGEDVQTVRCGFRRVEWVDHGPFRLNGQRLLLRGTHYHEDHAGVGAAVPDAVVRQTLRQIKDMGANFVRLGHYQQAPLVLDLCDELGLLVWEEIPWCRGGLGGERSQQQCRDMLTAMIDQHRNHPAVVMWGLGNEMDWPSPTRPIDKQAIRAFMGELNAQAHRLDASRVTTIRRCDFAKDIPDVYSPSIWAGWYAGRYSEYREATTRAIADTTHFFHAEYGGDSHAGRHAEDPEAFLPLITTGQGTAEVGDAFRNIGGKARPSKDGDWSESYIINLFDWHLHEQETMPDLTGAAQWIFKDFATPLRPENPVPRVNQKGVVARDGTPKESFYVFQSYWSTTPMVHLYGHTWPVRWGKAGEPREVKVFSNCPEVELFHNGVSLGRRRLDRSQFPASGLRWMVPFATGGNRLRAVGYGAHGPVEDAIDQAFQVESWGAPASLRLSAGPRAGDQVTVTVQAVDAAGVPCLDAAQRIRFSASGDGALIDNLGTAEGSRVVHLANGRARIGVRLSGSNVVISASAKGLPAASVAIGP